MKQKFDLFYNNVNNQFVEVSSSEALNQCMDLAYCFIFTLGIPKATIQHGYAYEVYTVPSALTRQYFDLIPNTATSVPQVGDLVIWNKGTFGVAGHIAICSNDADINRFKSFDQNFPLKSKAHLQEHDYNSVLGYLRPKSVSSQVEITDQTKIPQIDNMEVQAICSLVNDLRQQALIIPTLRAKTDELTNKINKAKEALL